MPGTLDPFIIPPPEPPRPAPAYSSRSAEEDHALRHFALALALVFAPAAMLLSLAILPGP